MYLWDYKALECELQRGSLPSKESFRYFLFFTLLNAVALEGIVYFDEPFSYELLADSILSFVLLLFGILKSYSINRSGDDNNFLERYVSLGIPIGMRLVVLWGLIYVIYSIVGYAFVEGFTDFNEHTTYIDVIVTCLVYLYFYNRLFISLRTVATRRAT